MISKANQSIVSARRLRVIYELEQEKTVYERKLLKNQEEIQSVEVRDLSFAYGGSMVLQRVNACFTAGNISAIVGESGSGKSTLLKVISGLYIPTNGGVCLHMEDSEMDIQEIGCGYCAYVPPDQLIFRDTVAGNICMAQSREDEKMTQCAKMANIWEYIEGLDQGF